MSRFVQLHLLTSYPPSNLNRDDTGRPKTAMLGNAQRLRVSSQSLKRAWRTSEAFEQSLARQLGTRTKRLGHEVFAALLAGGIAEKPAREWTRAIASVFGKAKSDKKSENNADLEIEQLAHISPEERASVHALVATLVDRKDKPTDEELKLLTTWAEWTTPDRPSLIALTQAACGRWLVQRGERLGFALELDSLDVDVPQQHGERKRADVPAELQFTAVDLRGRLRVTDPERLRTALYQGVGSAKSLGCGLLLVRRLG